MTEDEARMVQRIANTADGQCFHCAARLRNELVAAFPEHADTFRATYAAEFGEDE